MEDIELESGTIQFTLSDEYEIPEYTKQFGNALKDANVGKKIAQYDYRSHPARKDTDNDGINDKDDSMPREKGIKAKQGDEAVLGGDDDCVV